MLRRAAELDTEIPHPQGVESLDPAGVEEAALEAGVSRVAVRRALAELHSGDLSGPKSSRSGRPDAHRAVEARVVPCPADRIHAEVDRYLGSQLLQPRRRQGRHTTYRRRQDLVARIQRRLDTSRRLELARVDALGMSIMPLGAAGSATSGGRSGEPDSGAAGDQRDGEAAFPSGPSGDPTELHLVRLDAQLGPASFSVRARTLLTTAMVGIVAGLIAGVGLTAGAPVVLATTLAAGCGTAWVLGRRSLREDRDKVSEALAILLDTFEKPSP